MRNPKYLTFIIFVAILIFPICNQVFKITPYIPSSENRSLAAMPIFNLSNMNPFPASFEAWYSDHFRMRGMIMNFFYRLNFYGYNKSPIPKEAIKGKNGWLYLTGNNELIMYQCKEQFTNDELISIRDELEFRKKYLETKNCQMYFAIVPVKASVYPEYMPDDYERFNNKINYGKQLMYFLQKNSSIKPIDLYSAMDEGKSKGRLFHVTDSHWNEFGGLIASTAVMKKVEKDIKKIKKFKINDFIVDTVIIKGGNVAKMLTLSDVLKEESLKIRLKDNKPMAIEASLHNYPPTKGFSYPKAYEMADSTADSTLAKALIIRDSFGGGMRPSLSLLFSRTTYIWDKWEYKLNESIVDGEKPDVVIYLVLESHLKALLQNHSHPVKK